MDVGIFTWGPGTKPSPSVGRDGGCDRGCACVRCGSGSLSDEEDEELDEDDDELGVVLFGGHSPSGSSRM